MPSRLLLPLLAFSVALAPALPLLAAEAAAPPSPSGPTYEDVVSAIERGRQYLISRQNPDGSFGADPTWSDTDSALVFMTLACLGESPNRDYMDKALHYAVKRPLETTCTVSARLSGLADIRNKFLKSSPRYAMVVSAMKLDVQWLIQAQGAHGGWGPRSLSGADGPFDVLSTHQAVQALARAAEEWIEVPEGVWSQARACYFRNQENDGSWNARDPGNTQPGGGAPGYGQTAASLASLFALWNLAPPVCPQLQQGGKDAEIAAQFARRTDAALAWLDKHFTLPAPAPGADLGDLPYRLCAIEQVGMASGYKRFAGHDWYVDGVAFLLANQQADGSWGPAQRPADAPPWAGSSLSDTCLALLFLKRGASPVFFSKLRLDGEWNRHPRDLANLTRYLDQVMSCLGLNWQILDLGAPKSEFHQAPVLFISVGTVPNWTRQDKQKLRAFTDSGGTILLEATHGTPAVRTWFPRLAKEVWPEWPVAPLGADDPVYTDPHLLRERPNLAGIYDGLRTCVYYATDDISCAWQVKDERARAHYFPLGRNLFANATDRGPWHAMLAFAAPEKTEKYQETLQAGPRKTLRLARMKHGGNWEVGANYGGLARLLEMAKSKLGVNLTVKESAVAPVNAAGVSAAEFADFDVAYVAGSRPVTLTDAEIGQLKSFVAKGGFVWAEAAGGSQEFDASFRRLAAELGCKLKLLPREHPVMTGRMDPARGHDLASGVQFRRSLRIARNEKRYAELWGLFEGERMVGLYSPLDVIFSMTPYEAYGCRGYRSPDAHAVATNIVAYLTTAPAK